jgi:hypothetical protein
MLSHDDEAFVRAAFAPVRDMEPDEDLVAGVVARVSRRKKPLRRFALAPARPRFALQALATLALLGATLYSVPVTRAAIEDAGGNVGGVFAGWLGGESADAPGAALGSGEAAPEYLYDQHFVKDPRVIAEAGGYKLYAYIEASGGLGFELGDTGVGMGFGSAAELGDAPLHVLGPGAMPHADSQGHVPLFGIAAQSVSTVELTYTSGPPLRVSGTDGGFVLLAEPSRGPKEVIAVDVSGKEIGRQLVDDSPHPGPRIEWGGYTSPGGPRTQSRTGRQE